MESFMLKMNNCDLVKLMEILEIFEKEIRILMKVEVFSIVGVPIRRVSSKNH